MNDLANPIFHDEEAARLHFEALRWPDGRVCPHCGSVDNSTLMKGETTRPGLYNCKDCRKPFTATIGTVFERSHIPMHKWLLAIHLMCSSKKGISAAQLHRNLGFGSYRTAWFMAHRIRECMRPEDFEPPMGQDGGSVEVDETFYGHDPDARPTPKHAHRNWVEKNKVLTLVDRKSGRARSFHVESLKASEIAPILQENIAKEARLLTDEAPRYRGHGKMFADHQSVHHKADEYVRRGEPDIHTNTVEGYYSIFKRGMRGVFQHCSKHHLHRYLSEFDFRYSNREALGVDDWERASRAVQGSVGKRLMYGTTPQQTAT